jgi:hypothetical protein
VRPPAPEKVVPDLWYSLFMDTPTRLAAKISSPQRASKVHHYVGMPPEVARSQEARKELPAASVLLIEKSENGVLLIRFAADGQFAGDTWHPNIGEAKEQAVFEFGRFVSAWKEVPTDVNDVVAFMISS